MAMKKVPAVRTGLAAVLVVSLSAAGVPAALALPVGGGVEGEPAATISPQAAEGDGARSGADGSAAAAGEAQGQAPESTATYRKTEVVYATLSADGTPQAEYVVNRFDVEQAGTVADYGDYTAVQPLTSEADLAREGGATVFEADEGTFYYEGTAEEAVLPWTVQLTYTLDGREVPADELAGASGALAIHVKTSRNAAVESTAFYDSFMLQITFTLPGDAVSDVAAEGATLASAGQDRTVAFTVLPGSDGDFTLTAQVEDFHMDGAQVAALPYTSVVEMPDTSQLTDGMQSLADAVSQLNSGTSQLASGVSQLQSGAGSLADGSAAFGDGLAQLDASSGALVSASSQINGALSQVSAALEGFDVSQLEQLEGLTQLPSALYALADALDAIAGSAGDVAAAYDAAVAALDEAMASLPAATVTEEEIASLEALAQESGTGRDAEALSELAATYRAAQAARASYDAFKQAFDETKAWLDSVGIDTGSGNVIAQQAQVVRQVAAALDAAVGSGQLGQVTQLIEGMQQLAGQYSQFNDGLAQYASGVSALSQSYSQLQSGTGELASGVSQLSSGAGELASGVSQLDANTATLPQTMREQMDDAMADYVFPEFDPVSFASEENDADSMAEVQFVMTTAAIEQQEAEPEEEPEAEPTLWDRFLALFQG